MAYDTSIMNITYTQIYTDLMNISLFKALFQIEANLPSRDLFYAFCWDGFPLNDAIKVIKSSMPCANVTWMKLFKLPVYLKTDHGIYLLDVFLGNKHQFSY